ncbi:MAG: hypothetical protein HYU51_02500 [Candidatus Rokubacteria bacterium]|nr:hypothetical protein [Candidatus Rokubacteria bacterium]
MARAVLAFATLAVLIVVAWPHAAAEHEVRYRYTVLGYVKDARGMPLEGRPVQVVRDKTGLAYHGETDEQGLYLVLTRLGDESNGETLTLTIGSTRTRITVRIDPENHSDERGTRVDLDGTRWRERASWFRSTLARILGPAHETKH